MSVRERQVAHALGTRERQVERIARIEEIAEDQPTHHGYALNVKDRTLGGERLDFDDPQTVADYDHARERFWDDAEEIARQHGFAGVNSAGRQGGYCVPHPQPNTDDMYEHEVEEWLFNDFGPFACDILDLKAEHLRVWEEGE